jgi:Putative beta-barrel porin-2, OmpL-like. bbp2
MRKGLAFLLLALASCVGPVGAVSAAEEEKPLAPGWLSLDGSVGVLDRGIERGKSAVQDALGINFGGYLDTSYTWSSNRPRRPANISGRYFDKDHNKIVFNDFHLFVEKPEKDWGVGFRISGDFGRTGELLREATLWGKTLKDEPSAELREAYLTTTVPLGEGIGIKGGLFVTTLGTEIIPNPGAYNDNISRSFLFNLGIPLRHLGVLFSYPLLKTLTLTAGPVTGWDNPRDNNSSPSFLGGVGFTPIDMFSLASNVIYGPEQRHNSGNKRFTWSTVATIKPIDPLALYLEYTYGNEEDVTASGRDATWQGWAAIASFNWTDRFNTALRGEIFKDSDGARTGSAVDNTLAELTLTTAYKFTKMFLGRAEVRQDWADERFFQRGSSSIDKRQTTFAVQLIYTY